MAGLLFGEEFGASVLQGMAGEITVPCTIACTRTDQRDLETNQITKTDDSLILFLHKRR